MVIGNAGCYHVYCQNASKGGISQNDLTAITSRNNS